VKRFGAILLTIVSGISSLVTFIILTQNDYALQRESKTAAALIMFNFVLVLALGTVVTRQLIEIWRSRSSRLHARLVLLFTCITAIPTILVATFSITFFQMGIQNWFNKQVGVALEESVKVAESYLAEHKQIIRADAILMANDLNREAFTLSQNPALFNRMVPVIAGIRKVPEAIVFHAGRPSKILARTNFSYALEFALTDITPEERARADKGEVIILTDEQEDRVRAFVRLENFVDTYLLIGRYVDSNIISHMENTRGSVNQYRRLKANIGAIQLQFLLLYLVVALVLILIALWIGLTFASTLVRPIAYLARATERLKHGDFTARVQTFSTPRDEIGTLSVAFNEMAGQLQHQRNQLIESNEQIDARRRFSEAVLAGVSAGVVALNQEKIVDLSNRSARQLLGLKREALEGLPLEEVLPEFLPLVLEAEKFPEKEFRREVTLQRETRKLTLLVRVVMEQGYIITFDDITELQKAQRTAAWSDVARRIAHEIKNPLTPIQLAAERLKRKYLKEIITEPETFVRYTDTIMRHVGDIGRMVEEFVQFARMPAPNFQPHNLTTLIEDAVFTQGYATPNITLSFTPPPQPVMIVCDHGQITQVLTNLLKNASESIETRLKTNAETAPTIALSLTQEPQQITLAIRDNGLGFPPDLMDTLTEPYVTTRPKGAGLGLAIVKKVLDDHNARLVLSNILDKNGAVSGACVTIHFMISEIHLGK
jgi:two-component system nitrogen regulation sensor histidine kinase NtrY